MTGSRAEPRFSRKSYGPPDGTSRRGHASPSGGRAGAGRHGSRPRACVTEMFPTHAFRSCERAVFFQGRGERPRDHYFLRRGSETFSIDGLGAVIHSVRPSSTCWSGSRRDLLTSVCPVRARVRSRVAQSIASRPRPARALRYEAENRLTYSATDGPVTRRIYYSRATRERSSSPNCRGECRSSQSAHLLRPAWDAFHIDAANPFPDTSRRGRHITTTTTPSAT